MNKLAKFTQIFHGCDEETRSYDDISSICIGLATTFQEQAYLIDMNISNIIKNNINSKDELVYLELRNILSKFLKTKMIKFILLDIEANIHQLASEKKIEYKFDKDTILKYYKEEKYHKFRSSHNDVLFNDIVSNHLDEVLRIGCPSMGDLKELTSDPKFYGYVQFDDDNHEFEIIDKSKKPSSDLLYQKVASAIHCGKH